MNYLVKLSCDIRTDKQTLLTIRTDHLRFKDFSLHTDHLWFQLFLSFRTDHLLFKQFCLSLLTIDDSNIMSLRNEHL